MGKMSSVRSMKKSISSFRRRAATPGYTNRELLPNPAELAGEAVPGGDDWREHLAAVSRQRIVNKIMRTLKRYLPYSGPEVLQELRKIAVQFEEKNFHRASSQADYLRKISLKMLTMESKSQNSVTNSMPSNSAGNNIKPPDPVVLDSTAQSSQAK